MAGLIVMKFVKFTCLFLFIFIATPFHRVAAIDLSGYVKSYPVIRDLPDNRPSLNSLSTNAKLQINADLSNTVKFESSYELSLVIEKPLFHSNSLNTYRLFDLDLYLHDKPPSNKYQATLLQNLNRLNFSFATEQGDLTLGRTPVAFGVSKSISPNDVLTPFAFNVIDKEERTGVDSIIFKKLINSEILLDTGLILGSDAKTENSAIYLRPKITKNQLDLTLSVVRFKEKNSLGFELSHPIKDAGFWIDANYLDNNKIVLKDFWRGTTGVDYKFQNSFYLALEYHYNGSSLNLSVPYPEDFIFLRDEHYVILTMSHEINPLLIFSAQSYNNLNDDSIFLTPKLEYNLTDNSYLGLGAYLGLGNEKTTEFGRTGNTFYSSVRYYF